MDIFIDIDKWSFDRLMGRLIDRQIDIDNDRQTDRQVIDDKISEIKQTDRPTDILGMPL